MFTLCCTVCEDPNLPILARTQPLNISSTSLLQILRKYLDLRAYKIVLSMLTRSEI